MKNLLEQAKVIGQLLYNGDIALNDAIKALNRIADKITELENEADYNESLKDSYEN